jgi:predicted GNAT superfamily acetyltransferase
MADPACLFCSEVESVNHLLFDCVVARRAWEFVSLVLGVKVGADFESIASRWLCNKL